jgi:hypothetical protein
MEVLDEMEWEEVMGIRGLWIYVHYGGLYDKEMVV